MPTNRTATKPAAARRAVSPLVAAHRVPSRLAAFALAALAIIALLAALAGCGGSSTATQAAGVSSSSLTTTSSVTPSTSTSSAATATSTTTSSATISTASSTSHSSSVKPATAGGTAAGGSASGGASTAKAPTAKAHLSKFTVTSAAFPPGGRIPARYACGAGNVSPPLQWGKLPAGTSQLFVLALSLTAGAQGAIRWAVGGIDPSSGGIPSGGLPPGAVAGRSSDGHVGWTGICGTPGKPQAVIVFVYALAHPLHLSPGFDPRTVQSQLAGNTLGNGIVYGAYKP